MTAGTVPTGGLDDAADAADAPLSAVAALRTAGAAVREPFRFGVLDALARRADAQEGALRAALQARMAPRLAELQARLAAVVAAPSPGEPGPAPAPPPQQHAADTLSPRAPGEPGLAALGALIERLGREPAPPATSGAAVSGPARRPRPADPPAPLKSVAAFERTLTRMRTERVLRQAQTQVPQRAGPMNSSHVTNRVLQALRDLSPSYLEAFMAQVDTLLWLEQASGAAAVPSSRRPAGGDAGAGLVGGVRAAARPTGPRAAPRKRRA